MPRPTKQSPYSSQCSECRQWFANDGGSEYLWECQGCDGTYCGPCLAVCDIDYDGDSEGFTLCGTLLCKECEVAA
jgi:hypothetical protein